MRTIDPYRVLFEHLAAGAACCRMIVERDAVVGVDILDSNAAFAPFRGLVPRLFDALTQLRAVGRIDVLQLRVGGALLEVSAYPVGDDAAIVVIDDVTVRDQLEQRSRESQGRFEQAFRGNAAAMAIAHQRDLRIIDVNPRWLELFGTTRDEVIGRTSVELGLLSESRARDRIAQHQRFAEGHDIELELYTRTGAKLIVLASAKPIQIAEGPCTLTTLIDITARKYAEEAFTVAFSASPAGMILVDGASNLVSAVNKHFLAMTGMARDELVGRLVTEIPLFISPSREALDDEFARNGRLISVEVELACKTGPGVWALASTEVITLHDKPHRLSVFTDITALREINTELERRVGERTAALETSNRDLEAFSSSVSHELRAPLRAIHGFSEILLEDFATVLPPDAKELIERIRTSGSRMRSLVDALLGYARLGRDEPRRSHLDLDALVRSVVDELLVNRELGGRLELQLLPLGSCHADPSLLRPVWTNLIDNALKYSRTRAQIVIEIGRELRGDEVVYYVRDNGVGFDMAHADQLFGVFQRLHPGNEFEGTGIGLANVRRIIERHHGRVSASSELGRGSRFEFTLGRGTTTAGSPLSSNP
ncbi:MAG TPA: PAS domain S-box protein [Kofleriaceae bacterium]|nr:PAS domain S-box protein [Kofleriaceae bacterium]